MILSHKHKFIFIKTRKTASTSLETFLSKYCGEEDIVTPFGIEVSGHIPRNYEGFFNHIEASEIKSKVSPSIWRHYFKFTFERNPWDKMVSWYWFFKNRHTISENFEQFCNECSKGKYEFPTDFDKYTIDGNIAVDFIGKYESLKQDFKHACEKIGIPFDGNLPYEKAHFRTKKSHYSTYYNENTKNLIEKIFSKEILAFGYSFKKVS